MLHRDMSEIPEIVPEKIGSPINFKVIGIIASIVLGFHLVVNTIDNSDSLIYGFSMTIPLIVSIFAFVTAKRYSGAKVYSKAHLLLGAGFMLMFCAELTYFIYEQVLELDPYPSIADVFFFVFYPMLIGFLVYNIKFFAPKISKSGIVLMISTPLIATFTYIVLTIDDFGSFDFYYGIIFIAAASVTLGLAINTAKIFKGGVIGTAWLILVVGIIINVIGDVWYYYEEVVGEYTLDHPVNLMWYSSYLIILYALYKHKKDI